MGKTAAEKYRDELMHAHDRLHAAIQNVECASTANLSERVGALKAERIIFRVLLQEYFVHLAKSQS